MAIHNFRYSDWDGTQIVPDFSAEELLESIGDELLRGGDPERALRNLMRRGFELPDGRRFEGMKRLYSRMREYRKDVFQRYDPNGIIDQVREKLEEILRLERQELERRYASQSTSSSLDSTSPQGDAPPDAKQGGQASQDSNESGSDKNVSSQPGTQGASSQDDHPVGSESGAGKGLNSQQGLASSTGGEAHEQKGGSSNEFQRMLERMLERKNTYLDQLPPDNAQRIRGLREYDFLSPEAREAFNQLVGGMQRELMEPYFQGLKQGIGQITPQDMNAVRQMVQDLNAMLEATQAGDTEAFNRFMDQYRHHFPPGINTLEDLLEHLQRQASAMQSLLDSMDPQMRAELEAMMAELLRDDRLQMDLARLGSNMAAMGFAPQGSEFPFRGQEAPGFGESLDMMRRLQAMQDLENAMRAGDPFNAMANSGADPRALFGDSLGGQIEAVKDMADSLLEAGYLQRDGDNLALTARAIRKLGDAALREVFQRLKQDRSGGHTLPRKGMGGDVTEETRPYQFGDPFHVDIKGTVMNGVYRQGAGTPVGLLPDDFSIFETERAVQHATVLALDMSFSMYQNGLFFEAKKTAMALDSLIRGQFPRDALYVIGFANVAFELNQNQLPRLQENDYVQGTNYEMALSLAQQLLSRHRGGNRQILFITDGEPTACRLPNGRLYFNYPPRSIVRDTALAEAARCARDNITINTFALDSDPWLVSFLQEMTAINRGRMFLTAGHHLQDQVVMDYLNGRSVKHLH